MPFIEYTKLNGKYTIIKNLKSTKKESLAIQL